MDETPTYTDTEWARVQACYPATRGLPNPNPVPEPEPPQQNRNFERELLDWM